MAALWIPLAFLVLSAPGPSLEAFEVIAIRPEAPKAAAGAASRPDPAAETLRIFEAARPRFFACVEAAHARSPLAEEGTIVFVRGRRGARVQAAAVLEPARGDLAGCLREALRALPLDPLGAARIRVRTRWTAPPPPKRRPYPYRLE